MCYREGALILYRWTLPAVSSCISILPGLFRINRFILTVVALDSCQVRRAAVISLVVLQWAFAQWYESSGGTPPRVPSRRRRSQEISACLTSAPLTALSLTVCVEMSVAVTSGVMVLFVQTVAECAGVGELPVHTGDIYAFIVLQQLRGCWVSEGAAAPRAVLVRLWTFRLETRVLRGQN